MPKLSGIRIAAGQHSGVPCTTENYGRRQPRSEAFLRFPYRWYGAGACFLLAGIFFICISNNPYIKKKVSSLRYVDGDVFDVLAAARDMVHKGFVLLADPLYGNFKPNQQPYRTIVLRSPQSPGEVDIFSLDLVENALGIYRDSHVTAQRGTRGCDIDRDFRMIDFALIEETLRTYSLLSAHK
ncbi:MAG: GrdX family protein [Synergistes sp.]|nr:GrdX family protein [Synergistes sp.]